MINKYLYELVKIPLKTLFWGVFAFNLIMKDTGV